MSATELLCGTCGAQSGPTANFCAQCGARLTGAAQAAEYKQVTVLFADVVHSMDIAASVGAERLREIMADVAGECASVVQRFGGTVGSFTGDGIMAVFGAPAALEDHAVRACLAGLAIQSAVEALAEDVRKRDGAELRLRVGLNSGQVITGEIGTGRFGYTAVGEQVGMAQRMESVAPPGGVMLSVSTAKLVEGVAHLGEPELVQLKGADAPVPALRLLGMGDRQRAVRKQPNLVGRRLELSAIETLLQRAIEGHGAVVGLVGTPGIGKTRLVREIAAIAESSGVEVFTSFCQSHTRGVPFHAVARLLRAVYDVEGVDRQCARDRVRIQITGADPEDLLLLDELLGIADPDAPPPAIDPDARRRRLTALLNTVSLTRDTPAVYVLEDAHWIDEASESLLSEFLDVIPKTPSLVLTTYRPEYEGPLARIPGARTIALEPLDDSAVGALISELLGASPSLGDLGRTIARRAAGNPFFAEEIVRDLAERGVLRGQRGAYELMTVDAAVSVPPTLQAAIAARIDRLGPTAKRTLNLAAVIGSHFTAELLEAAGIKPVTDELLRAELIDSTGPMSRPDYVFHHPLIPVVAYESLLKSARAELHRRVAAALQACGRSSLDESAAVIAEHLERGGDLPAAYAWHMRAGAWLTKRDFAAAHLSWRRAARVADHLPADAPQSTGLRIAAKTMVCITTWLVGGGVDDAGFDALRELCTGVGDQLSMAVGMYGVLVPMTVQLRLDEACTLAAEQAELFAAAADPVSMTGVLSAAMFAKMHCGRCGEAERLAQRVIDLLDGDPVKGTLRGLGSPLAMAHLHRGLAGSCFGRPLSRNDFERAIAMQRQVDPNPAALVVPISHAYAFRILNGNVACDETTLRDTAEALRLAEHCGNDVGLALARVTRGLALIGSTDTDRGESLELIRQGRDAHHRQHNALGAAVADIGFAHLHIAAGNFDTAVDTARQTVARLFDCGESLAVGPAVATLVEALLGRGSDEDVCEASTVVDRLAATPVEPGFVLYEVHLLRLHALLAHARHEEEMYCHFRDRYRSLATSLGFDGHMKRAAEMG
ncbi:cyclase [Mycobacterium sp. 1274761.0]|nr:cyclase [Mycobacterium sp. 1274761.0]